MPIQETRSDQGWLTRRASSPAGSRAQDRASQATANALTAIGTGIAGSRRSPI
ncbi:hypothetical protein D9M68_117050 [compost metagenome]|jgi:hypothetical protein